MIRLATIPGLIRRAVQGVIGLLAIAVACSLLAAPLHRALEHDRDPAPSGEAHHCTVCALVKGQVDTPSFASSTIVFVRSALARPAIESSCPSDLRFNFLPPGRAPPISVIPS